MSSDRLCFTLGLPLTLVLSACAGPQPGSTPLQLGSMSVFELEVQPMIEERCASGGCHGRPERPLSLYAPGAQRMDERRVHLDEPLTDVELERNARRLAAFAQGVDPEDSALLCKPLAQRAGGCHHRASDVFADRSDPGYRLLRDWLRADAADPDGGP